MAKKCKARQTVCFPSEEMITVSELAELLHVSTRTVYLWVTKKEIPFYRVGNTMLRFKIKEVQQWLNKKGRFLYIEG